jgi:tetratricopeptide (TPR) repeat protein
VHYLQCIPEPSKAIITTRRGQLRRVWNIPLEGLPEPEALELIRRHAQRVRLPAVAHAEPETLKPLVDVTGGNPYAIETSLGYLKYGGMGLDHLVNALYQAEQRVGTIFDYIFARAWDVLDQDAQQLLMVMPFFIDSASKDAIGTTAGVSSYYLDIALSQVVEMSLLMGNDALDETQKRYRVHPLTRAFAAARLQENPDWEQEARERWVQWYQAYAAMAEDPANYQVLHTEVNNFAGVVEWLTAQERQEQAGELLCRLQHFLYAKGYWKTYIELAAQIVEWAIDHENVDILISLCQFVGGIVYKWRKIQSLEDWMQRLEKIAHQASNELLHAEIRLTHAHMLLRRGFMHREIQMDMAKQSMYEAIAALLIFRQHKKHHAEVAALNAIGSSHLARRAFEEATNSYHEALRVLDQWADYIPRSITYKWRAVLQGNLGIVRGRQGLYAEACEILETVLLQLTDQTDIAEAYVVLSLYQFQLGNEEQASNLRRKADDLIERLGLAQPICEEDQEWTNVELSGH